MPLGNWFKSPPFSLDANINAVVSDAKAAAEWYSDKFGLRVSELKDFSQGDWDDVALTMVCKFVDDEEYPGIYLMQLIPGKDDGQRLEGNDLLYCTNLKDAAELLSSRGISLGAVQEDGDGSRYFFIQDPDGNKLQILEESNP